MNPIANPTELNEEPINLTNAHQPNSINPDEPIVPVEVVKPRHRYANEIQQMMYVSGEKNDPIPDTVKLIEDIVREQVIELLHMTSKQAISRGVKAPTPEDFIFYIRKDKAKVNRLLSFLAWKDVRKNTKDSGAPEGVEDMLEEEKEAKAKRIKISLPWEIIHNLTDALDSENEDNEEIDEDTADIMADSLQRLKNADEITQLMSKDEYVHYSECRQASFTYRKNKKFREWSHIGSFIDTKPSEDVVDIMGFLTFDMVATLTETAINLKRLASINNAYEEKAASGLDVPVECGLFAPLPGTQPPLEVDDIQQAYRHLQLKNHLPLRNFKSGMLKSRMILF